MTVTRHDLKEKPKEWKNNIPHATSRYANMLTCHKTFLRCRFHIHLRFHIRFPLHPHLHLHLHSTCATCKAHERGHSNPRSLDMKHGADMIYYTALVKKQSFSLSLLSPSMPPLFPSRIRIVSLSLTLTSKQATTNSIQCPQQELKSTRKPKKRQDKDQTTTDALGNGTDQWKQQQQDTL